MYIQILEKNGGFLDVIDDSPAVISLSISDIRDISSRTGAFSKTIRLAGSPNNNKLLNSYYEINVVEGVFDVNKRTKVAIMNDDKSILMDNCYMQLLNVNKKQSSSLAKDQSVEYEVLILSEMSNFFRDIDNKNLVDLGYMFGKYDHIFGKETVVTSHTRTDGYVYVMPWIDNNKYYINEVCPSIFVKDIFDAIHASNGFTYDWDFLPQDYFDRLLFLYRGDSKKFSEDFITEVEVIAKNNVSTTTNLSNVHGKGTISNIAQKEISIGNEIKDNKGYYNNTTFVYSNPYKMSGSNKLIYSIEVDFSMQYNNAEAGTARLSGTGWHTMIPKIILKNGGTTIASQKLKLTNLDKGTWGTGIDLMEEDTRLIVKGWPISPYIPSGNTYIGGGTNTFEIPVNNIDGGNLKLFVEGICMNGTGTFWRKGDTWDPAAVYMRIIIDDIRVTISPAKDSYLIPGQEIKLAYFLPNNIKQSEFLKSIYQMYNLYGSIDPLNPKNIIYKSRDEFYDSGDVKDWTNKIVQDDKQTITFLPDLVAKKLVFSYKDDSEDPLLSGYKQETTETYGQASIVFRNEYIKGEEKKESIFSPTINYMSPFGANLPVLPFGWKGNHRILLFNGVKRGEQYIIDEGGGSIYTTSSYPFVSMLDDLIDPRTTIEWGMPKYYALNVGMTSQNNLYNRYWKRTLAQIDQGKMFTANFYLTNDDIYNLKLNDKIKVKDNYYYINSIIDFNMNSSMPTKVELLTQESNLLLPKYKGGTFGPLPPLKDTVVSGVKTPTTILNGGFDKAIKDRIINTTASTKPMDFDFVKGKGNTILSGFSGILIGDDKVATDTGIFVDSIQITNDDINLMDKPLSRTYSPYKENIPVTRDQLLDMQDKDILVAGQLYVLKDRWDIVMEAHMTENTMGLKSRNAERYLLNASAFTTYQALKTNPPNGTSYTTSAIVRWGGKLYQKTSGGTQTLYNLPDWNNPNTSELSGFTVLNNSAYYDYLHVDVEYNIYTDIIWQIRDTKGNIINNPLGAHLYNEAMMFCDLGHPSTYKNNCGIIINNNVNRISGNNIPSDIYGNNLYTISDNTNYGEIAYNYGDLIINNDNAGDIRLNKLYEISFNKNIGDIRNCNAGTKTGVTIYANSNNGHIEDCFFNNNNIVIGNNNNNGYIKGTFGSTYQPPTNNVNM
jgi:hypothetical protein